FLPKGILAVSSIQGMNREEFTDRLLAIAKDLYEKKEQEFGGELMREVERIVLLRVVDTKWMDHIDAMDQLRREIGIRAMGNDDPVRAYSNEGYEMFNEMNDSIREETVRMLYHVVPAQHMERQEVARATHESGAGEAAQEQSTFRRSGKKIGRNDPCWCGSGKKFKHCHGKGAHPQYGPQ
ncbi:MAG: SEC-C metal-binding domain-containing protein, partial [Peptoniphilaceae bacterium]|nr:SEC-C metal-binding domain-containing protein [Peptoniphilaceae bacterium]